MKTLIGVRITRRLHSYHCEAGGVAGILVRFYTRPVLLKPAAIIISEIAYPE